MKTVMGDIARSSAVAATALGVVGIAAVKTSSDFNAAMSGVGAVANASAAEMESLRNAALKRVLTPSIRRRGPLTPGRARQAGVSVSMCSAVLSPDRSALAAAAGSTWPMLRRSRRRR